MGIRSAWRASVAPWLCGLALLVAAGAAQACAWYDVPCKAKAALRKLEKLEERFEKLRAQRFFEAQVQQAVSEVGKTRQTFDQATAAIAQASRAVESGLASNPVLTPLVRLVQACAADVATASPTLVSDAERAARNEGDTSEDLDAETLKRSECAKDIAATAQQLAAAGAALSNDELLALVRQAGGAWGPVLNTAMGEVNAFVAQLGNWVDDLIVALFTEAAKPYAAANGLAAAAFGKYRGLTGEALEAKNRVMRLIPLATEPPKSTELQVMSDLVTVMKALDMLTPEPRTFGLYQAYQQVQSGRGMKTIFGVGVEAYRDSTGKVVVTDGGWLLTAQAKVGTGTGADLGFWFCNCRWSRARGNFFSVPMPPVFWPAVEPSPMLMVNFAWELPSPSQVNPESIRNSVLNAVGKPPSVVVGVTMGSTWLSLPVTPQTTVLGSTFFPK